MPQSQTPCCDPRETPQCRPPRASYSHCQHVRRHTRALQDATLGKHHGPDVSENRRELPRFWPPPGPTCCRPVRHAQLTPVEAECLHCGLELSSEIYTVNNSKGEELEPMSVLQLYDAVER